MYPFWQNDAHFLPFSWCLSNCGKHKLSPVVNPAAAVSFKACKKNEHAAFVECKDFCFTLFTLLDILTFELLVPFLQDFWNLSLIFYSCSACVNKVVYSTLFYSDSRNFYCVNCVLLRCI